MTNNLKNTKNRLSLVFSVIVFAVIFLLSSSFFSFKYFNKYKREQGVFSFLSDLVVSGKVDRIKLMGNRFGESFSRKFRKSNKEEVNENLPSGIVNHVHIDKNNFLISRFIIQDIKIKFFEEILESDKYFQTTYQHGFLVRKFDLKRGEKFVIFKKLKYDLDEYIEDILRFFIISLLFSIFIYFTSRKFIDITFMPVEQNIDDMKHFIHNAGHELKTPISVIDSNLQLLFDIKEFDESMNLEMRNEIKKLNSLIESLIDLSDVDSFKNIQENNLKEILEEIIKEFKDKINAKEITLNTNLEENIVIQSNRSYLYMFLSNIIGNAIKYNKQNGKIKIYYKNKSLFIKDTGLGISKKEIDKIFDRFYKVDNSRNSEGFGIGLSLVKKIAGIYNWKIHVSSEDFKGTEFQISF